MEDQNVLQALLQRCEESRGKFSASVPDLAVSLGVEQGALRRLLQKWRTEGAIETRPNGRRGLLIALPGTLPAAARKRRPASRRPLSARPKTSSSVYCPWCGNPIASEWRFCYRCGHALPDESQVAAAR